LVPQPPGGNESHFCLICGSFGSVDAILNLVLFAPLGIGLALYGLSGRKAVVAMCLLSAAIETTQFLLIPGRDSTLGDVITNTAGGAIGFMIGRYAAIWLRPLPRTASKLAAGFAAFWLTVQAISSFGFLVSLPPSQYYGQIARALGHFAVFSGVVLGTQVGDARIADTRLENSAEVRDELLHGAEVATTIVPAATPTDLAPIVRIVDSRGSEIVLIAQQSRNLIFGIRTRAAVLRLRQPYFALNRVFRGTESGVLARDETLALSASYDSQDVSLTAQRQHAKYGRRIPVTSSLGWVMLMPLPWAIEGTPTEAAISMLWIAFLLSPAAYWGSTAVMSSRSPLRRRVLGFAAFTSLVLYVGLVVVPHTFGIRAAPLRDWIATSTAIVVGVCLALIVSGGTSRIPVTDPGRSGRE
jgi:VanZ family protein